MVKLASSTVSREKRLGAGTVDADDAGWPPSGGTRRRSDPPAARWSRGTWKWALEGHSRPTRRSKSWATGPTESTSSVRASLSQSGRSRLRTTCSCQLVLPVLATAANRYVTGTGRGTR